MSVLDGEGEDDRRTAKTIYHIVTAIMNSVRMNGHEAEDRFFRQENEYMPSHWKAPVSVLVQDWDEQRKILGFE